MSANRFRLSRRAVLRGAAAGAGAIAVPLPRLVGMLDGNGTAYADGAMLPKRFGVWFFGNGNVPGRWNPAKTGVGDAWQLSEELAPLASVKSHLAVVTGVANWQPALSPDIQPASSHHLGAVSSLTGDTLGLSGKTTVVRSPSIDQVIASGPESQKTPFRSLEVGLSQAWASFYPDDILNVISHTTAGTANPPEFNPRKIFTRLFGDSTSAAGPQVTDTSRLKVAAARKTSIDLVLEDTRQLRLRLGSEDRSRLDAHIDGIHQLEKQIAALSSSSNLCPIATDAGDYPDRTAGITKQKLASTPEDTTDYPTSDAPSELNDIMSRLMALAWACDRTRVVSYMLACGGAQVVYRSLGTTMTQHELAHHEGGDQPMYHRGVVYAITLFKNFLETLKNTPDGASNLLDNCCIYSTSDVGLGASHSITGHPALVAGKAGGALKGNIHYQFQDDHTPIGRVLFTVANLMGVPVTSFGADEFRVTDGVSAILA